MTVELEAREELLAAAGWYDDQRAGLGDELLSAVDAVLVRVESSPMAFPPDPFEGLTVGCVCGILARNHKGNHDQAPHAE